MQTEPNSSRRLLAEEKRIAEVERTASIFGPEVGGLRMLRTSERKSFKRCPQQWWWAWVEGLVPNGASSTPLWFGQGIHVALADWYLPGFKRGIDPRETWHKFIQDEKARILGEYPDKYGDLEQSFLEAEPLGDTMLSGYLANYGTDEAWEVLAPEQAFGVVIAKEAARLRAFKGTFDGVIRDHSDLGRIKLIEHKNFKTLDAEGLSIDDQAGSYWAVATKVLRHQGMIGPKECLDGIVYNMLRKAEPDPRPVNEDGFATNKPIKAHYIEALHNAWPRDYSQATLNKLKLDELAAIADQCNLVVFGDVSKIQPAPLFARHFVERTPYERNKQIRRIQSEASVMNKFLSGEEEIYKSPDWTCKRFCQFFELCELEESTPDYEDFKNLAFHQRDPYADHRKSASE